MDSQEVTIGIIYCGYNQLDNIKQTLSFWNSIEVKGYRFIVSVVSVPFKEYKLFPQPKDGSHEFINSLKKNNIHNLLFEPEYITEIQARSLSLQYLVNNFDPDIIWQVDSDEFYTENNVKSILSHITTDLSNTAFKINFKNYIYDGKHYLDDFCVPKINKLFPKKIYPDRIIYPISFISDNEILFYNSGKVCVMQSSEIPKEIAWVKHYTWMHKNGKQKVQYQLEHFGACSYKWNNEKQELEIDLNYYKIHGYTVPKIHKEE